MLGFSPCFCRVPSSSRELVSSRAPAEADIHPRPIRSLTNFSPTFPLFSPPPPPLAPTDIRRVSNAASAIVCNRLQAFDSVCSMNARKSHATTAAERRTKRAALSPRRVCSFRVRFCSTHTKFTRETSCTREMISTPFKVNVFLNFVSIVIRRSFGGRVWRTDLSPIFCPG